MSMNVKRSSTPSPMRGKGAAIKFLRDNVGYSGDDCLIWPMSRQPSGYAGFGYEGKCYYAHRYMCELVKGPPPTPEHEAAHSCGKGHEGCVHPMHLSWKTISENMLDCRDHGTSARHYSGNRGRLTDADVVEIKALKGYLTQAEIAAMFNVSPPTVRDIFSGRSRSNRTLRTPFTPAEVLDIRTKARTMKLTKIARQYGSTHSSIWRIASGKSYRDVCDGQREDGK